MENRNKKKITIHIPLTIGVVLMATAFLFLPIHIPTAQENTNELTTNTNTNTAQEPATNQQTDQVTTEQPDSNVTELDQQILDKQQQIQDLKKKIESYQESLKVKQQEALTLKNQLSLIDTQIANTETDLERITAELEAIELEIVRLKLQIEEKEQELALQRERLAEYLRLLYQYDQKTPLEIFLTNDSFSEFYNQIQYSEQLQSNVQEELDEVKQLKEVLVEQQTEREAKKNELASLQEQLNNIKEDLEDQKMYKQDLLVETKENETTFASLLDSAKIEQQQAESDIQSLEQKVRQKLEEGGVELETKIATLSWPVSPEKGISAYFHDPTYIFRKYFEHPAIDIRAPQGTAITAAANGYVARAKDAGFGYSYIMLVHNDEISTVYGHVSRIDVQEDTYVVRGQQIGLVGGTPGTPGAGRLTTGPHLHFEVRSNGIPVNPLDYLP